MRAACAAVRHRVFSIGGACLLPCGEIPVLSDAGPLKQRKNPKFAPGMDRKQGVAIHAAGVYIAVSAGGFRERRRYLERRMCSGGLFP